MPETDSKNEKITVSIRMPANMYQMLKILANAEERSLSKQIIFAIGEWVQMVKERAGDSDSEELVPVDEFNSLVFTNETIEAIRDKNKNIWKNAPGRDSDGKPFSYTMKPDVSQSLGNSPNVPGVQIIGYETEFIGGASLGPGQSMEEHTIKFRAAKKINLHQMVQSGNIKVIVEDDK